MGFIRGFGRFWYDFLIGDDWKIAAAVGITLGIGAVILVTVGPPDKVFAVVMAAGIMTTFVVAMRIDAAKK